MRAAALVLASLFVASTAHAEPPASAGSARTTGLGFAGTGVLLTGFGGYFAYKGTQQGDMSSGNVGIALLAGGIITTGVGVTMFLSGSTEPEKTHEKPAATKQALVIGPGSATYWMNF